MIRKGSLLMSMLFLGGAMLPNRAAAQKRRAAAAPVLLPGTTCAEVGKRGECAVYDISLVQLLANPERFNGRTVRVIGYAHLAPNNTAIYLSREASDQGVTKNGVWVDIAVDSLARGKGEQGDRYVRVVGVFNAHENGSLGLWSGSIENIRSLEAWGKPF